MEELTAEQKQELAEQLAKLKAELEDLLESSSDSSRVVDLDQPIGRLSRMDALQQQAMAKAGSEGMKKRLLQVESALQALRQERYGECRKCEEPIGYPRLKANPETPLCIDCQTQMEKNR